MAEYNRLVFTYWYPKYAIMIKAMKVCISIPQYRTASSESTRYYYTDLQSTFFFLFFYCCFAVEYSLLCLSSGKSVLVLFLAQGSGHMGFLLTK